MSEKKFKSNHRQGGFNKTKNQYKNKDHRPQNNRHLNKKNSRVNKPTQNTPAKEPVKGPLFDKSKLVASWKINRKAGPGLVNGLNTCFLNSVLECLTYTPPLAQELLKEEHKKSCRMDGFCALCAMEVHVRRSLKDHKSFVKGAAIMPSYFTSNLKGNKVNTSHGNDDIYLPSYC
jgi:ubiquitin C-terminal hydrolase